MVGLTGGKRSRQQQQKEQLFISSARAAINIPNKSEAGEGGAGGGGKEGRKGRRAEEEDEKHEGWSEEVQLRRGEKGTLVMNESEAGCRKMLPPLRRGRVSTCVPPAQRPTKRT